MADDKKEKRRKHKKLSMGIYHVAGEECTQEGKERRDVNKVNRPCTRFISPLFLLVRLYPLLLKIYTCVHNCTLYVEAGE